jgi:transcriptional regulator with XRE-family HTH domain
MQHFSQVHTPERLTSRKVGKMSDEEREVRWRVRRWVLHYLALYRNDRPDAQDYEFAEHIGISRAHLSNIQNAKPTDLAPRLPGLDVVLKLSSRFGIETDRLLKHEPRREAAGPPREEPASTPSPASSTPARPRRRGTGAGS